ncbi:MAG: DNRLRE domain-containing protein [Candidatus Delongbacteria bacterium]|nr:DNRLRE domain-containing protein [Candidatus Delongbacteria bacterium]MBN2833477.1 DNRLRE domain-containing protein [Candidatus Delongbacteria bacterium]
MKIIVFLLTLIISFVSAETLTLDPQFDMYTDVEHPGTAPNVQQLWTANFPASGNFQRIMMKFDIEQYRDMELESAVLKLTRFYSCPSGGTTAAKFIRIAEDWDESAWNFNTHADLDNDVSMPYVFSGPGGNTVHNFEVDITTFINNWFENSIDDFGFAIVANSNQKFSKFYSKENANQSYRPKLELTVNNVLIEENLTENFSLTSYPNPFNPSTTINFSLSGSQFVQLKVANSNGSVLETLFTGNLNSGSHSFDWSATSGISTGVYYSILEVGNQRIMNKMVLIK